MTPARTYWACQLAGWGLYVGITVSQELIDGPLVARTIVEPMIGAALGLVLTHGCRAIARRSDWTHRSGRELLARVVIASFVLAGVQVLGLGAIEAFGYGDHPSSWLVVIVFAEMRWTLLFFTWIALYVGYGLLRDRQRAELERTALVHSLQQAKLRALESALNPHFLFNALNTVKALAAEDPARADAAIDQLARLLRYALAAGGDELVTVARELESVDDYLAIERLRLDRRLAVERDVTPEALRRRIPAMVIQTLVENAIKHGIARLPEGGTVRITARVDDRVLKIDVENPRALAGTRTDTGIGLANAAERLGLLCGEAATLDLDLSTEHAIAHIVIPEATA